MGIYDRDYYRQNPARIGYATAPAVRTLLITTFLVWLGQILFRGPGNYHGFHDAGPVTRFLGCWARDLFEGVPQIWRPVTAIFAHDVRTLFPVIWSMAFLLAAGRRVEAALGARGFFALYLLGGSLSILGEVVLGHLSGNPETGVFGASGAVLGVLVMFTLLDPKAPVSLLLVSVPRWSLCVLFILVDLRGMVGPAGSGARAAHLVGAGVGVVHHVWSLRTGRRFFRSAPPVRDDARSFDAPGASSEDRVAARVDELLDKVSRSGLESLTPTELQDLKDKSAHYRK